MGATVEIRGSKLWIELPHELDHHSAEAVRSQADKLLRHYGVREIWFDFQNTVFMDSSGIGVIMGRYKQMRLMGGRVAAVHVGERIRKLLTMSGIYQFLDIYEEAPGKYTEKEGESL